MDFESFLGIILLGAIVILVSSVLDRLYAQVLALRPLYYVIRLPGVILHELTHVIGCLITGAEIKKVVLFSREGGSVIHTEPKIPILGTVIISTAPLLILPFVLSLMTSIFTSFFGCSLTITVPKTINGSALYQIFTTLTALFPTNLFLPSNVWFLIYLYLCTSIILSLSPSRQDLTNAAIGIVTIVLICLVVIWSGYRPVIIILDALFKPLADAFMIGIVFELIVSVISAPIILIWGIREGG